MIKSKRQKYHGPNGNLVIDDDRPLGDGADAKNGYLWLVDDGCSQQASEDTWICNREGAALDVLGSQLLLPRSLCQTGSRLGDSQETFFVGILDNRNDEAPVERDCHTDVDLLLVEDVCSRD